mgnify:CR=1 FL=1
MSLPEWCQTHSLKEFLELLEDTNNKKGDLRMNEEINVQVDETSQLPAVDSPDLQPKLVSVETVGYVQTEEQTGANDPVVA